MDLADAAGGDKRLVLLRGGEQEGGAVGIQKPGDVRGKGQATGGAAHVVRGFDGGAKDGLVSAMDAVKLADGQHEGGGGVRMAGCRWHIVGI